MLKFFEQSLNDRKSLSEENKDEDVNVEVKEKLTDRELEAKRVPAEEKTSASAVFGVEIDDDDDANKFSPKVSANKFSCTQPMHDQLFKSRFS